MSTELVIALLGFGGAVLGVVAALLGRKKIQIHRHESIGTPHPTAAAPTKAGGKVFREVITGLAALAVLLVIAAIVLVATKPSEAQLRAAAEARMEQYFEVEYRPDGTKVLKLPVGRQGPPLWWITPQGWHYRDEFIRSELVFRFNDGKEVVLARGVLGKVRVFDD